MTLSDDQVQACRRQFPALARQFNGLPAVYFDGPAGTQVPRRVIDAISHYLSHHNANHGGLFPTSLESDQQLDEAHRAMADFLGADDPDCIAFGPNMTTLTFALSRSLARTWQPGDEVVVTLLDHDANYSPWVLAAQDAGATARTVNIRRDDATLDVDDLRSKLSDRTRLVAIGCASNASGSVPPIREICQWVHDAGGLVFLDAVHYAPHALIDVQSFGCDFLACSAYKFFGPHIGVMWGRRRLLEELTAYKLRPAPDSLPGKWMTGTQNHECIVGVTAAVDYLADLGRQVSGDSSLARRPSLELAFRSIQQYERELVTQLISGLQAIDGVNIWGITDPRNFEQRLPTVTFTHSRISTTQLVRRLGEHGIFAWHGNYYALNLSESLGLEPEGMVRIGLVHYNTRSEIDRFLETLPRII